ncbi:MAG: VWA domain-containing protein [Deltaproteobacteria bacterium]|nr:VWA domain-containing protein [Deltaproteobacteria bacterium]
MTRVYSSLIALGLVAAVVGPAPVAAQTPRCDAPRVLLVVDKSSSMLGGLPAGGTKWEAASTAVGELTAAYETSVDFGLMVFPFPDRCEPGQVTMDVGPHPSADVFTALGDPPPVGGSYTPMAQTLDGIAAYAPLLDPEMSNHVILITDGWQWCDPYDSSTRFTPVDSVTRLAALGVTVHVVGFGGAVDALTLNRAAVAAGTALPGCDVTASSPSDPNHCYQQADDLVELRAALSAIARDITEETCDGLDNDCDGQIDEGFDVDADGYTVCGTDTTNPGTTDPALADCDDAADTVHPGATEVCDGVDNDCDGSIDPGCECFEGADRPCGMEVGACTLGVQLCTGGIWAECTGGVPPEATDPCDGVDNDCDGTSDEDADCGEGSICVDGACEGTEPSTPVDPVVPPPETTPTPTPPVVSDGNCACSTPGAPGGPAPLPLALALGLAGFALVRIRRGA